MYVDKDRRSWRVYAGFATAVMAIVWSFVIPASGGQVKEESARAVKAAVERCALQCYVVEGFYPSDLTYLKEEYGLQMNEREFYIRYEIFASNVPPAVKVIGRKEKRPEVWSGGRGVSCEEK